MRLPCSNPKCKNTKKKQNAKSGTNPPRKTSLPQVAEILEISFRNNKFEAGHILYILNIRNIGNALPGGRRSKSGTPSRQMVKTACIFFKQELPEIGQKLSRNYFFERECPQMPANCHKCQIDLTDYIKKSIDPWGAKS